jgi:hypothetical protein
LGVQLWTSPSWPTSRSRKIHPTIGRNSSSVQCSEISYVSIDISRIHSIFAGLFLIQPILAAPDCYRRQCKVAYEFVRNACSRLESSDASHKALFERLRACFAARGFKILLPEEDNVEPLRAVGAGRLLRLFETFLQDPTHNAAASLGRREPPPPPRSRRFQHQPLLWRTFARRFATTVEATEEEDEGPVAEAQLGELRTFHDTQFMPLLFVDIGNRFQQVRTRGLISIEGMFAVELPVMWDEGER